MKVKLRYTNAQQVEQYIEVFPIMDKCKFKYEKVKTQATHRITFGGTLDFINNESQGIRDYDIFYQYHSACTQFKVEIYRDCGGDPWIGWFTIYMGKYDHDIKSFSVTPKPYDKLYLLDPIWAKEFNLFKVPNLVKARSVVGLYNEEFEYTFSVDMPFVGNATLGHLPIYDMASSDHIMDLIPLQIGTETHTLGNWLVEEFTGTWVRNQVGTFIPWIHSVKMIRTIMYTNKDENGDDVVPELPDSGQPAIWIKDSDILIGGRTVTKWKRAFPYNFINDLYLTYQYTWITGDIDNGGTFKGHLVPPPEAYVFYTHCRLLKDCINFMLTDSGLTLKSELFDSDELYVDAASHPGVTVPNYYHKLLVTHKSEIIRPDPSNPSTIWPAKFEEFITDLCTILNLMWDVNGNEFVLEHLQYWEQGGVAIGENIVGIDLTIEFPKYLEDTSKWAYKESEFAAVELFKFMDATSIDWQPMQFEYKSMCLGLDTKEYTTRIITTDLPMCQQYFQGDNDGLMLLSTEYNVNNDIYLVIVKKSEFESYSIPNGYLAWSWLLPLMHFRGRLLPTATFNFNEVLFTSTKRIKQQTGIEFPLCGAEFDSKRFIKTWLGDALLETGEEDLKTGIFTANLLHE